jgi:hypothetical protein
VSNVRRNVVVQELTQAEINRRKLASDILRLAIANYLEAFGETERQSVDALRKSVLNMTEESLGITGRELPGWGGTPVYNGMNRVWICPTTTGVNVVDLRESDCKAGGIPVMVMPPVTINADEQPKEPKQETWRDRPPMLWGQTVFFPRKITFNLHFTGTIEFDSGQQSVPAAGNVLGVTFWWSDNMSMVGVITLAPIVDVTITAKPCLVEFPDGTTITVDMIDPAATFAIPDGAVSGIVTPQPFVNPQGSGPAGAPFPFDVPTTPPPPGLPLAGVVTGVAIHDEAIVNPLSIKRKKWPNGAGGVCVTASHP